MGVWTGGTYTFSYSETANNKVDSSALEHQVRYCHSLGLGTIKTTTLNYVNDDKSGEEVAVHFWAEPSPTEKLVMENVASSHNGEPLDRNRVDINMPSESDGRLLVAITPAGQSWNIVYTSRGDDLTQYAAYVAAGKDPGTASGRFSGPSFKALHPGGAASDDNYVDTVLQYAEVVLVHDGEIHWGPQTSGGDWDYDDWFSIGARFPASTVNSGGLQNCVLAPVSTLGNIIVPVPEGYGTHELTKAVPIPVTDRLVKNGFWSWDFNKGTSVTPNRQQDGTHNLFTFQPPEYWIMSRANCASYIRSFLPDAYRVEEIHPNWQIIVRVCKKSTGSGWLAGKLTVFRKEST